MQVHDKVTCAYAGDYQGIYLTTFKTYDVVDMFNRNGVPYITIIDDQGGEHTLPSNRFVLQENN